MSTSPLPVAFLYDDSAYTETLKPTLTPGKERPVALVGRQVAGREFLDAYLTHGDYERLTAVAWNQTSADTLAKTCRSHPRAANCELRLVAIDRFLERAPDGAPAAAAPVLYTPCPPDPSFAWMRQARGPQAFSLCGVTHTLATASAARVLCDLITAPYETHDALVCTSRAVLDMVRAVAGSYAAYLGERLGCTPVLKPRLELIPLGVNPERYRPATPGERDSRRTSLKIRPDAVAVLFVGRFTPHAKAHPFPMFQGLARAAERTGQPVHLILSGWYANEGQLQMFVDGLREFAPGMPVSVVNGLDPDLRYGVWQAADVFTSLSDNIQETFGLVIAEAMACGLPVVAADWNGYRDLVTDGATGLLVPTVMVRDATAEATVRLLLGAVDYDAFLGECNQAVAVDVDAATAAYARLLADASLRQRLGAAGRERVLSEFTWQHVVKAYERLWREQDLLRRETAAPVATRSFGPPCYPAPEVSFAGYPTAWLGDDDRVRAAPDARERLVQVLRLPLCSYDGQWLRNEPLLRAILTEALAPRSIGELKALARGQSANIHQAAATLAWLLKYGLLKRD